MSTIKKDDDFVVSLPQDNEHELQSLAAENRSTRRDVGSDGALSQLTNSSSASILGYCLASISMTVVNKYVVSGEGWNLMFLYLGIQVSQSPLLPLVHAPWRIFSWRTNADTCASHRQLCVCWQFCFARIWDSCPWRGSTRKMQSNGSPLPYCSSPRSTRAARPSSTSRCPSSPSSRT